LPQAVAAAARNDRLLQASYPTCQKVFDVRRDRDPDNRADDIFVLTKNLLSADIVALQKSRGKCTEVPCGSQSKKPRSGARMQPRACPELVEGAQALGRNGK
jgi:hypothetical protein